MNMQAKVNTSIETDQPSNAEDPGRAPLPLDFRRLFIRHEYIDPVMDSIEEVLAIYRMEGNPKCLLIMGPSGSGKTRLIKKVCQLGRPIAQHPKEIRSIVACEVPSPTSVKGLVTTLLGCLGVQDPERGTTVTQTERLIRLIQSLGIEMLILDEFQHLVERRSNEVIEGVADWLKVIINRMQIPVILVGLPDSESVFAKDDRGQLRRRFTKQMKIEPFVWQGADEFEDGQVYKTLLRIIEQQLDLPAPSNLADEHVAKRMLIASRGLIGYTAMLVEDTYRAVKKANLRKIDIASLSQVFVNSTVRQDCVLPDPFLASDTEIELVLSKSLAAPCRADGFNGRMRSNPKEGDGVSLNGGR